MKLSRYAAGLLCVGTVVLLWVLASFLIEDVLSRCSRTFLLNWSAMSMFQLYYLILLCSGSEAGKIRICEEAQLPPLTRRETVILAAKFFPAYFLASYLANASFGLTDVPSASILMSTSSLWTLIVGVSVGQDKLTRTKCVAVGFSTVAVCIIGLIAHSQDTALLDHPPPNATLGNICALGSALLYGLYSVLLKGSIVHEDRIDMRLFFGIVGTLVMVLLSPLFLILDRLGVEPLALPDPWDLALILVNGLFGTFLASYLWLLAVLKTNPVVTAIGISLCTPVTLLFNAGLKGESLISFRALAGVFTVLGFLTMNLPSFYRNDL